MSKVIITGSNGFLGHHMVDYILTHTNYDVIAMNSSGSSDKVQSLVSFSKQPHRVKFVTHDIRNKLSVDEMITDIEGIYHIGGQGHVPPAISDPLNTVLINVVGTCNMLDYARNCKSLKSFVYFSSDEVFGPVLDEMPHAEDAEYNVQNPYAASKAGAEQLCLSYFRTYNTPIKIARCMNIFGEGQPITKFIPSTIQKLIRGEPIIVHGCPQTQRTTSRCYLYAFEVCSAVDRIVQSGANGEIYNIAGDCEIDNFNLVHLIATKMNKSPVCEIVDCTTSHSGHGMRHAMSGAKIQSIGWKQTKSFEEWLEKTIEFYVAKFG